MGDLESSEPRKISHSRLGEATGPGFVEMSPAREISSSAKDAERAKRQPVTASSLFVSDGFDALQELDLLENCKSLILGWLKWKMVKGLENCKKLEI